MRSPVNQEDKEVRLHFVDFVPYLVQNPRLETPSLSLIKTPLSLS
ncbi:MAG: hypothetical protein QXR57_05085 [Metallosphaera sp.]